MHEIIARTWDAGQNGLPRDIVVEFTDLEAFHGLETDTQPVPQVGCRLANSDEMARIEAQDFTDRQLGLMRASNNGIGCIDISSAAA